MAHWHMVNVVGGVEEDLSVRDLVTLSVERLHVFLKLSAKALPGALLKSHSKDALMSCLLHRFGSKSVALNQIRPRVWYVILS